MDADVIVVGAGLAGLVAAAEAGRRRQAGCCCSTRSPSSRWAGRRSGPSAGCSSSTAPSSAGWASRTRCDLALQDWLGSGAVRPRRGPLAAPVGRGVRRLRRRREALLAAAAWATGSSRSSAGPSAATAAPTATATRCRASTSPGAPAPASSRRSSAGCASTSPTAACQLRFRHRVDELVVDDGAVVGVRGSVLEPSDVERGKASSRVEVGDFELRAQAVIVTSGGIGGNHDLVRKAWPERLGTPPKHDGRRRPRPRRRPDARRSPRRPARSVINPDRMWHYVEGIRNWDPIWDNHGIRILPGPSSLWLDATGKRLPAPYFPGFDTLGTLEHLRDHRLRLLVVRAHPEDHREGVRALGLRAEPRPHRQGRQAPAVAGEGRARRARSRRSSSTARTSSSPTPSTSWSRA